MVPENLILFLPNFVTRIPFLNYDLSKINIVNYASCSCGAPREDVYHYFFTCPNYAEIRLTMTNNLNWIQTIDLNLLTCESGVLTYEENINILKHVFNFIKSSERFLVAQLFDKNLLSNLASIQHNLLINSLIVYNIFLYVLYACSE